MRVLLTGAFGNIGRDTLKLLLTAGYDVRCFDVDTAANRKWHEKLMKEPWQRRKTEVLWGDIRKRDDVERAVDGVGAIIHLAAIIAPLSEKQPDLATAVNVGGTENLIEAAKSTGAPPKFIFTGSISVHGRHMEDPPPRRASDPVTVSDHYTEHKVKCEEMLRNSGLPWSILRVGVVLVADAMGAFDPIVFEIPLDQRMETVHAKDAALACVNAIDADTVGKTLLIGGGEGNQVLQRDFLREVMGAAGIGMLPESAFKVPQQETDWFYTDFMDTEESQRLLHFQVHTLEDYVRELKGSLGFRRVLARAFAPVIRRLLAAKSPYYTRG